MNPAHLLSHLPHHRRIGGEGAGRCRAHERRSLRLARPLCLLLLRRSAGQPGAGRVEEDGITIFLGDDVCRILFETPLTGAEDVHLTPVNMVRAARAALEVIALG